MLNKKVLSGGQLGLCGIQNSDFATGSLDHVNFQILSLESRSIWYHPSQYFPLIPLCTSLGGGDVNDVSGPEILTYGPGFWKFVSVCNQAGTRADRCESLT